MNKRKKSVRWMSSELQVFPLSWNFYWHGPDRKKKQKQKNINPPLHRFHTHRSVTEWKLKKMASCHIIDTEKYTTN